MNLPRWRGPSRGVASPRGIRRLLRNPVGIVLLLGLLALVPLLSRPGDSPAPMDTPPAERVWIEPPRTLSAAPTPLNACRAVDGDTLHCAGTRVRLRGVDTPEYGEPRYREATRALQAMVDDCATGLTLLPRHRSHDRIVGDVLCAEVNLGQAMDAAGWSKPVGARR